MESLRRLNFSALAAIAVVSALVQAQDLPRAPQAEVFALVPQPGYFTEPAVAVNPSNPKQVVTVFQDNVHASYSEDAGHSWHAA